MTLELDLNHPMSALIRENPVCNMPESWVRKTSHAILFLAVHGTLVTLVFRQSKIKALNIA